MAGAEDANDTSWVPRADMEFGSDEEAYQFYNNYAKLVGFCVRKSWVNRRASGVMISRTYVCHREGYRGNKRDECESKSPRVNERTGCLAHLTVKITPNGRYRVSEFHPMHNHELAALPDAQTPNPHHPTKRSRVITSESPCHNSPIEHLVRQAGGYRQIAFISIEDASDKSWTPRLGMEFAGDDEAYEFFNDYGKRIGFDVRKAWVNRRASGIMISRTYVCYKEGFYGNKRDGSQVQSHKVRAGERTGCRARMVIKLVMNGRYRVTEFQPTHNHELVTSRMAHTLKAFRASKKAWDVEVAPGCLSKTTLPDGDQNPTSSSEILLPSKKKGALKSGSAGAVMQYMQERQVNDPSLYYAVRLDGGDRIASVFWTDGKSVTDYYYFGDVVCFDTTYKANNLGRPLALFYGVNHHKQIIIFGSALVYEDTEESFKWLFQTFKSAMYGKQPRVALTDQNASIVHAVHLTWPGTAHRVCMWHIYHSAMKRLGRVFKGSRAFEHDFKRCVFDCEEGEEFVLEWSKMLKKYNLEENEWLKKIYRDRGEWAVAYVRETFSADMRNTQRAANLEAMLKEHLNAETSLLEILRNYERLVDEWRRAELQTDLNAARNDPSATRPRMLKQATNLYTPRVFDMFQREFEMSMDCLVFNNSTHETASEFKVTSEEDPKEYLVRFDSSDGALSCTCKKFEFVGIQCRHALKALDKINVKELPHRYFLKRWRKDAKTGLGTELHASMKAETDSSGAKCFSSLCRLFGMLAARAAETRESCVLVERQLDQLLDYVYQLPHIRPLEETEVR